MFLETLSWRSGLFCMVCYYMDCLLVSWTVLVVDGTGHLWTSVLYNRVYLYMPSTFRNSLLHGLLLHGMSVSIMDSRLVVDGTCHLWTSVLYNKVYLNIPSTFRMVCSVLHGKMSLVCNNIHILDSIQDCQIGRGILLRQKKTSSTL